jgi:hypothetical protein
MHNSLTSTSNVEKKTREDEDMSDLPALISGLGLSRHLQNLLPLRQY